MNDWSSLIINQLSIIDHWSKDHQHSINHLFTSVKSMFYLDGHPRNDCPHYKKRRRLCSWWRILWHQFIWLTGRIHVCEHLIIHMSYIYIYIHIYINIYIYIIHTYQTYMDMAPRAFCPRTFCKFCILGFCSCAPLLHHLLKRFKQSCS